MITTVAASAPASVSVICLRRRGFTNHGRLSAFADDMLEATENLFDVVVGFQRMPGLDVLFCGDWCFADHNRQWWKLFSPRARRLTSLERACFGRGRKTQLLLLARPQAEAYRRCYRTEHERMTVLPPTLDYRLIPDESDALDREILRNRFGFRPTEIVWLWLGLQPHTKGLDRAVQALAITPNTKLVACGPDLDGSQIKKIRNQAKTLGCMDRLILHGLMTGEELKQQLSAADLLMHPARVDVTGMVIAEALAAGLPVVATENCGFAPLVLEANAGLVVPSDAAPKVLSEAGSPDRAVRERWAIAARDYIRRNDLGAGLAVAKRIIAELPSRRGKDSKEAPSALRHGE